MFFRQNGIAIIINNDGRSKASKFYPYNEFFENDFRVSGSRCSTKDLPFHSNVTLAPRLTVRIYLAHFIRSFLS